MSEFRHSVAEFIRASNKLLEAKDLSDGEEDSVRICSASCVISFLTKETTQPTKSLCCKSDLSNELRARLGGFERIHLSNAPI
jgi:hypothetical protein